MSSSSEEHRSNETRTSQISKKLANVKGSGSQGSGSGSESTSKGSTEHDKKRPTRSVTNLALENIGLDPTPEGPTWSSKWESLLAMCSFVTCSANFWFFPFLCGYYGAWFPYQFTICYVFISVPLLYMEMALGQYASASPLSVFSRMTPAMAGLSAGMCFIMIFRTVSLATWASYDLTITANAAQSAWRTPPWQECPSDNETMICVDYKLADKCTWDSGTFAECENYQKSLIATRGLLKRMSPFLTFITSLMFKNTVNWTPPDLKAILSSLTLWIAVGIVSIGGSKVLGKTGTIAISLLFLGTLTLTLRGMLFGDTLDTLSSFLWETSAHPTDPWKWVWSWADAAAHAVRALNVGCGGIQKFASLNKFRNKITRDVLIISVIAYLFNMCTGLFSFMYLSKFAKLYYPDLESGERIKLYTSPVFTEVVISEVLTTLSLGSFWLFTFWLTMVLCSAQGIASYIWVISSMILERLNGSRRKYGKPLASWHKRAVILGVMCILGLISSLPFLGNGGMNLMSTIESNAAYGTLFIAFVQIVTVSYVYGFKRFSVNIRAMIGTRPNIFWWLNWLIISPLMLLITFGCVVSTTGNRESHYYESVVTESIGWSLVIMPMLFVILYFVREDIDRRRNLEPFGVMIRATGDWGPMNPEDRRMALKFERQLRVRY